MKLWLPIRKHTSAHTIIMQNEKSLYGLVIIPFLFRTFPVPGKNTDQQWSLENIGTPNSLDDSVVPLKKLKLKWRIFGMYLLKRSIFLNEFEFDFLTSLIELYPTSICSCHRLSSFPPFPHRHLYIHPLTPFSPSPSLIPSPTHSFSIPEPSSPPLIFPSPPSPAWRAFCMIQGRRCN